MPFYEYVCKNCQHEMEVLQKVSDPVLRKCPECGKQQLQKLISAAGFQLKGTGWYVTDFKDKGKPKAATVEKSAKATDTDSTTGSTTSTGTETN
jgi:putative FmdB family regulatory protein